MTDRPEPVDLNTYRVLPDRGNDYHTRSYLLLVDGKEVPFNHAMFVLDVPGPKPKIAIECGLIDDGRYRYDGIRFVELGGGGVALVPFLIWNGELWVATTLQYRFLLGREEPGFIRGYKPPGVPANEHILQEAVEEFGESVLAGGQPFPLIGEPVNSASHVIDTRPLPNEPNPGGYMFGVPLAQSSLEFVDGRPTIKDQAFNPSDKLEALRRGRIMPWWEAIRHRDGVLSTGVARLMSTLHERGQLRVSLGR